MSFVCCIGIDIAQIHRISTNLKETFGQKLKNRKKVGRKIRPLTCGFAHLAKNGFKSGQSVSAGRWCYFGVSAHFFHKIQFIFKKVEL